MLPSSQTMSFPQVLGLCLLPFTRVSPWVTSSERNTEKLLSMIASLTLPVGWAFSEDEDFLGCDPSPWLSAHLPCILLHLYCLQSLVFIFFLINIPLPMTYPFCFPSCAWKTPATSFWNLLPAFALTPLYITHTSTTPLHVHTHAHTLRCTHRCT